MIILALDSTAKVACAAVCDDQKLLANFTCNNGMTHSEILLPMAEDCLKRAGLTLSDVDLLACNVGPGSFTGVRIGAAVIKGLAFGKNIPCASISTLESLAQNLVPLDGLYCPVMDARRDQVYNAIFKYEDGALTRITEDRAVSIGELASELKSEHAGAKIYLSGDGYEVVKNHPSMKDVDVQETPHALIHQNAVSVALCALKQHKDGNTIKDTSLSPTYLRMPSAERERLERMENTK